MQQHAIVTFLNDHGLTVLTLQRLATASTENSSAAVAKYCNNNLRIANVKMNITKMQVLASS